jgi:hypothetical protein
MSEHESREIQSPSSRMLFDVKGVSGERGYSQTKLITVGGGLVVLAGIALISSTYLCSHSNPEKVARLFPTMSPTTPATAPLPTNTVFAPTVTEVSPLLSDFCPPGKVGRKVDSAEDTVWRTCWEEGGFSGGGNIDDCIGSATDSFGHSIDPRRLKEGNAICIVPRAEGIDASGEVTPEPPTRTPEATVTPPATETREPEPIPTVGGGEGSGDGPEPTSETPEPFSTASPTEESVLPTLATEGEGAEESGIPDSAILGGTLLRIWALAYSGALVFAGFLKTIGKRILGDGASEVSDLVLYVLFFPIPQLQEIIDGRRVSAVKHAKPRFSAERGESDDDERKFHDWQNEHAEFM